MPSVELYRAFHNQWPDPPPELPYRWAGLAYGEELELYEALNGKWWFEVDLRSLPTWFSPLIFLPPGADTYYLASYVQGLFQAIEAGADWEIQARIADILCNFLEGEIRSKKSTLTAKQAAAYGIFLSEIQGFVPENGVKGFDEVFQRWPAHVSKLLREEELAS